jgi:GntR family transcriptional regulator / MocR family aminotransferase
MRKIAMDNPGEAGLSRQIYGALKARILSGQMAEGERIPSTRGLAAELGVSRNTVSVACDLLWTEGFIERRQGAPSRVAEGLRIRQMRKTAQSGQGAACEAEWKWDFKTGQPDLTAFPWKAWNDAVKSAADTLPAGQFTYNGPKGYEPLCEEIAGWLFRARNMEVDPEDVFISSGSTQALYLLVDMLRRENRAFLLEDPCHPGIRTMITDKGLPVDWMPVDAHGAQVAALDGKEIAAVYVTPSHQFPLGGILPAGRRAALIRLAAEKDFYVIEDDYDSEFRYAGLPVSPIYSMDSTRVLYVGTFSKTMFPALRIGFVVLPKALHPAWRHSRNYMDVQNPVLEQAALALFLKTRKMDRHIRRMRKLYGDKRAVLTGALQSAFGNAVIPWGDASGLHVTLQFPGRKFDRQFIRRCENDQLRVSLVSQYCSNEQAHPDMLLLGYGHLSVGQIQEGVEALKRLIPEDPHPETSEIQKEYWTRG